MMYNSFILDLSRVVSGRHYPALCAFPDTLLLFNSIVGIPAHTSSLYAPLRLSRQELAILQL